jgi:hypothetical protein
LHPQNPFEGRKQPVQAVSKQIASQDPALWRVLQGVTQRISSIFYTVTEEIYMNKLLAILVAGLAAWAIAGTVTAADNNRSQQPTQQEQIPAQRHTNAPGDTQGSPKSESTEQNPQYAAALKKCDAMSGARKTKCVDSAKKKFGQM